MTRFLPYGRQSIDEDDIAAVAATLRGDWLTTGPAVQAFEADLAARLDVPYAIACSSATAGLHLAMLALGVGPGDAVVVPSITFLATANAARFVGANVIFADVDPLTGIAGPEHFEAAIARAGQPVKVLAPVHLGGQMADPAAIAAVAEASGAQVIEDACHAIGARYADDLPVGACRHSSLSVFSFHAVKTIAMGEGGAVTTRDPVLAERLARLRTHGMMRDVTGFTDRELAFAPDGQPNPWYYEMAEIGYNYRATDIQCALGRSQLGKLERFVKRRQEIVDAYDRLLAPLRQVIRPVERLPGQSPAWHLYVALIDFAAIGTARGPFMRQLHALGIGSQVHYIPVHRQPYYRALEPDLDLPGADAYYDRCLSLPLFPDMTDEDITRVVEALIQVSRAS